jgi:hypothetical protein
MLRNRLAFSLVLCAIAFPMLALDKLPDPLAGTAWSRATTSASAVIPLILASVYAVVMAYLLRKRPDATFAEDVIAGSAIGLVPAVFYTLVMPFSTTTPPLFALYLLGAIFGPVFGGSAFALLRRDR